MCAVADLLEPGDAEYVRGPGLFSSKIYAASETGATPWGNYAP